MAGKCWGAGLPPEVCVLWMNGEKDAAPLRGTILQCERQDEMTLQEAIETFTPETRLSLCTGGWSQICLIQTWSFSSSSLYGRFMNVWSYCSGDNAFYAKGLVERDRVWGHGLYREERAILRVAVNTWGEAVDAETQHGSFSIFLPWASPFACKCISQECYTGYNIDREYWIPQEEDKQAFLYNHISKDCKEWRQNAMSCI